jgi:peptidase S41-like protein
MMTSMTGRRLTALAAAILACLLAQSASTQEAAPQFDRAGWQQDFAQLKTTLERTYVNLAWMGSSQSGVDVPRLERRTNTALAAAITDAEAERALLDFVAGFHDGHFSQLARLSHDPAPIVPEPAAAALDPQDPKSGCAALGYAATSQISFSLPFESLPGFALTGDGVTDPFRSGTITGSDGRRVGLVRIQEFEPTAFPAICLGAWATLKAAGTPLTPDALEQAASDAWFAALAETLTQLRQRGAVAVLVDVGRNGGGGDSGDWMPRMFTDRAVASAPLLMVDAPVSAGYFDEQIDAMNRGLAARPRPDAAQALGGARRFFAGQKAKIGVRGCDLSWVWSEQRTWNIDACNNLLAAGFADGAKASLPRKAFGDPDVARKLSWATAIELHFGAWNGPAYVLTDNRTFSAAEMFTATMKDNGIAKTLGARTGGDGCGFMVKGDPLVLSHSQLRFRIPNCMRLRADGTDEVAGIAPDFPLAPVLGESSRSRAARALATIAKDLPAAP